MLFVVLIPLAGAIWLFVLLLKDGQKGDNQYGQNPKTSPEKFSESAKLKSAGIALIVAAIFSILLTVVNLLMTNKLHGISFFDLIMVQYRDLLGVVARSLLFSAGVLLLNVKQIYIISGKMKIAIILLLSAFSVLAILYAMVVIGQFNHIQDIKDGKFNADIVQAIQWLVSNSLFFVSTLWLTLLTVSILFAPKNKNLIRTAAVCAIVFSGLFLLNHIYLRMGSSMNYMFSILSSISYIVLAGMFLTKKGLPLPIASNAPNQAFQKTPNETVYAVGERKKVQTSFLDKYRMGLSYLNECGAFDETKFREFNRITGSRFSDADI